MPPRFFRKSSLFDLVLSPKWQGWCEIVVVSPWDPGPIIKSLTIWLIKPGRKLEYYWELKDFGKHRWCRLVGVPTEIAIKQGHQKMSVSDVSSYLLNLVQKEKLPPLIEPANLSFQPWVFYSPFSGVRHVLPLHSPWTTVHTFIYLSLSPVCILEV